MKQLDAATIAKAVGGKILSGDPTRVATQVSTDTRTLSASSCWFALRGENFDGNKFGQQAAASGASILVVEHWQGSVPAAATVIQTDDSLRALQQLAHWYRRQLDIEVVGITGSNGKTSTKDFTNAVLSTHFKTKATKGNLNNHIGVPLTVLGIPADAEAAIVEMGMNHAGEIAPLCEIAAPRVGIITNVGTAHIEFLGSREGIAEEKGALVRSLPEDGALFLPAECDFRDYYQKHSKAPLYIVGDEQGVVHTKNLRQDGVQSHFTLVIEDQAIGEVVLPVIGRHMIQNALLAAGAGWFLGVPPEKICEGLSKATLTSGRLRRYEQNGITVFDDTYNANPESMAAAINTLAEVPIADGGRRFIVMGYMGELGEHSKQAHQKVGALAAERGLTVIAVGKGAKEISVGAKGAPFYADLAVAAKEIGERLQPGDVILFKASRSAALERVMNQIFPEN